MPDEHCIRSSSQVYEGVVPPPEFAAMVQELSSGACLI